MPKVRVTTPKVKEPTRFYSQAVKAHNFLFIAGQIALNEAGELVGPGDAVAQTRQALENIKALTEAAGATMEDVVKLTVYLTDVSDAASIRQLRADYFPAPDYPTTTLIGNVALADPGWVVEVEAIVAL